MAEKNSNKVLWVLVELKLLVIYVTISLEVNAILFINDVNVFRIRYSEFMYGQALKIE